MLFQHWNKQAGLILSSFFKKFFKKNEDDGGAWHGEDLPVTGGRKQGLFKTDWIWIYLNKLTFQGREEKGFGNFNQNCGRTRFSVGGG